MNKRPVFHLVDPISIVGNRITIDKVREHLPSNHGEIKEIFMSSAVTWDGMNLYNVTGIVLNPLSNIITLEVK